MNTVNTNLALLPQIIKIRGPYLYTNKNTIFDLYLDDGRGINGFRDKNTKKFASNAFDKGLTRPYPGLYLTRLTKAISALFPEIGIVKAFMSEEKAINTIKTISDKKITLLRAFCSFPSDCDIALLRLPCPQIFSPYIVCTKKGSPSSDKLNLVTEDIIPDSLYYASSRGIYTAISLMHDGFNEDFWKKAYEPLQQFFSRNGPYLYFAKSYDLSTYKTLFSSCLQKGLLLPPVTESPLCISPEFNSKISDKLLSIITETK